MWGTQNPVLGAPTAVNPTVGGLSVFVVTQLFSKAEKKSSRHTSVKQNLTWNSHSRLFKVMCFEIRGKPMRNSVSLCNISGLISKVKSFRPDYYGTNLGAIIEWLEFWTLYVAKFDRLVPALRVDFLALPSLFDSVDFLVPAWLGGTAAAYTPPTGIGDPAYVWEPTPSHPRFLM